MGTTNFIVIWQNNVTGNFDFNLLASCYITEQIQFVPIKCHNNYLLIGLKGRNNQLFVKPIRDSKYERFR